MAPPPHGAAASSASSSWKNPAPALQVKYNLHPLPEDFEPTKQELELLDMYDTIRRYEKEAARLKEEAARAKLEAAAAKYEEQNSTNKGSASKKGEKKKKKKREESISMGHGDDGDDEEMPEDEDDDDEEEEQQKPKSLAELREAKLAEWREEIEEQKGEEAREEAKQEALRAELLGQNSDDDNMDLGPTLKRKRHEEGDDTENKKSLIANIQNVATPPHDFSKKLGFKSWEGKVLFPIDKDTPEWTPPESAFNPNDEALSFVLEDFDVAKAKVGKANNTVAIKYTAPADSKRFSINIAAPGHRDYDSVSFHFNPRQFEKGGQLVLNNKQEGMWGQAINVPLSRIPKIFGEQSSTVIFQITEDGFDVFVEDKHCARLEHREPLPSGSTKLYLQFPATDDRGKREKWTVYKVWYGHKDVMVKEDLADVYGVNAFVGMHPKKLFIKGLPSIRSERDVEVRRAQLERAFRKYGGDRGVTVTVPTNATFAFIECESEQQANKALEEMAEEYDIKRARRKRHEALEEERAAAEAARKGNLKETRDWD